MLQDVVSQNKKTSKKRFQNVARFQMEIRFCRSEPSKRQLPSSPRERSTWRVDKSARSSHERRWHADSRSTETYNHVVADEDVIRCELLL